MKKTMEKDQITNSQPELCKQCKFMIAQPRFQNMCLLCYNKKKSEDQKAPRNTEGTGQQQEEEEQSTLSDAVVKQEESDSEEYTDNEQSHEYESPVFEQQSSFGEPELKKQINFEEISLVPLERQVKLQESSGELQQRILMINKRGYREIIRIQQNRCNFCPRKTGLLGFICNFCKINFCKAHRLPEEHECSIDFMGLGRKKLRLQLLQCSIQKMHKGKLAQI